MSASFFSRRSFFRAAAVAGLTLGAGLIALAQQPPLPELPPGPNENVVKPQANPQDRDEIFDKDGNPKAGSKLWVLDFRFKPLRSIKVNVPGRGEQVCYYLWYQVLNRTKEPHFFVPDFEIVTQDTHKNYRDEILPTVQEAIARIEDPHGVLNIENSVTITKRAIPPIRANAVPRPVTGVAIWTDPSEPLPGDSEEVKKAKAKMPKLIESNSFMIFIAGLSNGWAETEPIGGTEAVVRRKTLKLEFERTGDGALRSDRLLRYKGYEWLYRASTLKVPKEEGTPMPMPEKP